MRLVEVPVKLMDAQPEGLEGLPLDCEEWSDKGIIDFDEIMIVFPFTDNETKIIFRPSNEYIVLDISYADFKEKYLDV